MKRLTVILFMILLFIPVVVFGWATRSSQPADTKDDETKQEFLTRPGHPNVQFQQAPVDTNSVEGKERVRGFSTTVIQPPPPYIGYYGNYDYGNRYWPSLHRYYQEYNYYNSRPLSYKELPIIKEGNRYDSALVYDPQRSGLRWDPILPSDSSSRIPGAVVNPNFRRRVEVQDYVPREQPSISEPGGTSSSQYEEVPSAGSWERRALVSKVDRSSKQIDVITSDGSLTIDARYARIVNKGYKASINDIGEGDSIRIYGDISGLNRIKAVRIEKIGSTENTAKALHPVRAKGRITCIDYPSFTFKLDTDLQELRILADEETLITLPDATRKAFQKLKVGQMVKVTGIGGLTSGYVAREIVIIEGLEPPVE